MCCSCSAACGLTARNAAVTFSANYTYAVWCVSVDGRVARESSLCTIAGGHLQLLHDGLEPAGLLLAEDLPSRPDLQPMTQSAKLSLACSQWPVSATSSCKQLLQQCDRPTATSTERSPGGKDSNIEDIGTDLLAVVLFLLPLALRSEHPHTLHQPPTKLQDL